MNKHVYSLTALFAAIALMTISCGKDKEVDSPDKPGASVEHEAHIIAQDGDFTKTLVAQDGNGYISKWEAEDNVALFQSYELSGTRSYLDAKFSTTTTLNSEKTKADFTVVLDEVQGAANYKYVTAYPTTAVTRDGSDLNFVIPSEQTFGTTSFDKNADVMVSQMVSRPTFSTDALEMGFARIGAIVKMTVTGLTAGETVQSVVFSTTEEGKYFAGTIKYDMTTQKLKDGITAGAQTLTLNAPENTTVPANGSLDVWFRSAVVTLENNFTVVVNTLDGTTPQVYTKKVDLTDKTFAFNSGKLAKFSVGVFHKVIEEGYYLVSYSGKMMTVGTAANSYRGCEDLVAENAQGQRITDDLTAIWGFAFNAQNGKYTVQSVSEKSFLIGSGNSTSLSLGSNATAFTIEKINNGYYIGNDNRYIGYNESATRFSMYLSTATDQHVNLSLYKTIVDKTPKLEIENIILNDCLAITNPVIISPTKAQFINTITVNGCFFDSQCTTGNEVDWVSVDYSSGVLSYTVQANPNESVRTAYIKVTGANEDGDETVVVFSITQPQKTNIQSYTYVFTSKSWAATRDSNYENWTSGKEGGSFITDRGIQVTSSATGANGTSPYSFTDVEEITVTYSTNASSGAGSIEVKVGNNDGQSKSVTTAGGTSDRILVYKYSSKESGKVKLTVPCTSNSIYVKSVTIKAAEIVLPTLYTITYASLEHGSISGNANAYAGDEITLTATPNEEYLFDTWTVTKATSGDPIEVTNNKFTMPEDNVNVSASFIQKTYAVTFTQPTGAAAQAGCSIAVKVGETPITSGAKYPKETVLTLEATLPNEGYTFGGWAVDGADAVDATAITTTVILGSSPVSISAAFTPEGGSEEVVYTLEPITGTNNNYASNCDITINDITWNLSGNSQQIPWRIGGKNLDGINRVIYSKTALSYDITKIEITHGAASSITVNSMTVIVATDASFSNVVSTLTPEFKANSTVTVERPANKSWNNCYYKIIYNVSVSGNNNRFLEFTRAKFSGIVSQSSNSQASNINPVTVNNWGTL